MRLVIAEFNRAAVRNIELLEERIQTLNDTIQKANHKIVQMEDRIDRSNKPIVVEKRIEMPAMKAQSMIEKRPEKRKIEKEPPLPEPQATQAAETVGREVAETVSKAKTPVSEPAVRMASQDAGLSRADKLKAMIQEGRTKQELIELGFLENEINLFLFLVKKDD